MSDTFDRDYHAARAAAERRLAETTADPKISALHWELATLYERLVNPEQDVPLSAAG